MALEVDQALANRNSMTQKIYYFYVPLTTLLSTDSMQNIPQKNYWNGKTPMKVSHKNRCLATYP